MIVGFDDKGNLPPGIHPTMLSEIEQRFSYNKSRKALFQGIKRLAKDLKSANCPALYIDGPFVTNIDEPEDYTDCWETHGVDNTTSPVLRDLTEFQEQRKKKYRGDIHYLIPELSDYGYADPLTFFQWDTINDGPKGILAIDLREPL